MGSAHEIFRNWGAEGIDTTYRYHRVCVRWKHWLVFAGCFERQFPCPVCLNDHNIASTGVNQLSWPFRWYAVNPPPAAAPTCSCTMGCSVATGERSPIANASPR